MVSQLACLTNESGKWITVRSCRFTHWPPSIKQKTAWCQISEWYFFTRKLRLAYYEQEYYWNNLYKMCSVLWSIMWLLILIFISFWVACIAAGFYIFLLPFAVCISPLELVTDFLLQVVQFPQYCTEAMIEGRGFT